MEDQLHDDVPLKGRVKAALQLGSEMFFVNPAAKGVLSEQLAAMKEESMNILKTFITEHNVPNDVPDEAIESVSEDETTIVDKLPERPRKRK